VGHLVPIAVEVDTLEQLEELLTDPVDVVLLDNMGPADLAEAVRIVRGRMVTEASGRITADTAPEVAAAGVDVISVGWLTHSSPILHIWLDIAAAPNKNWAACEPTKCEKMAGRAPLRVRAVQGKPVRLRRCPATVFRNTSGQSEYLACAVLD